MAKRRSPADSTPTSEVDVSSMRGKPRPPSTFAADERAHWMSVIALSPADRFAPSDLGFLAQWAQAMASIDRARARLAATGDADDALATALRARIERETRIGNVLSTRLRIGPLARYDRTVAARMARPEAPPAWQRDGKADRFFDD